MVRPEVEVEVFVDDVIFDVEVFAVPSRFRLVPGLERREVKSVWERKELVILL